MGQGIFIGLTSHVGKEMPMRTPQRLYAYERITYHPALLSCPHCGALLVMHNCLAWGKTGQTLKPRLRTCLRKGNALLNIDNDSASPHVTGSQGSLPRRLYDVSDRAHLSGDVKACRVRSSDGGRLYWVESVKGLPSSGFARTNRPFKHPFLCTAGSKPAGGGWGGARRACWRGAASMLPMLLPKGV